ncbi:winged helix-turn-helix domain-containing protein [Streptomyces atriruber]|uniref:winged helix-turn-helix domain-containing protein n=1 Tax=Streptomyces atriruber TaxID=545121 RepID=UPI000AA6158A|nr:winged helix-turn-helix domain-containing protein [Streptomyces atriruber]
MEDRGGLVLSALAAVEIAAYTATGEHHAAARRLELPLPDALFDSVHALDQLRARGHYYLATHRHTAALAEFLDAGRLARRWGLDHPRRLPWRTDAAGALLHLGERERAARLIAEQCDLPTGRDPRPQGAALRLRAALAPSPSGPGCSPAPWRNCAVAAPRPERHHLSAGPLRLDARTRKVHLYDDEVRVTRKEFDLLAMLLEEPGTVLRREEIMARVWDENWFGSTRTLDVHVGSLRGKLGSPHWIGTVRGVGYRLTVPAAVLCPALEG